MRWLKCVWMMLALLPLGSQAAMVWSSCQTVTGVVNYIPFNSSVWLSLSPGIPGCSYAGTPGAAAFMAGVNGVDLTNINGLLAGSLTALSIGKGVMILYDNTSSNCYGQTMAVGGLTGSPC
jgi:hypothetical protein